MILSNDAQPITATEPTNELDTFITVSQILRLHDTQVVTFPLISYTVSIVMKDHICIKSLRLNVCPQLL